MKYIIRRAIVGALAVPVIAGIYTLGYALLVGAGAQATATASMVWDNGIVLGIASAIIFAFYPQIAKRVDSLLD